MDIIDGSCLSLSACPDALIAILTTMTGQRSRAEMKAKEVRSEVAYGATGVSIPDTMSIFLCKIRLQNVRSDRG